MADHGEVQYATADGNDYAAHEATYKGFLHFAFVGAFLVINIVLALAIGGVGGHWLIAAGLLMIVSIAAAIDLGSGSRMFSSIALAVSFLTFALTA